MSVGAYITDDFIVSRRHPFGGEVLTRTSIANLLHQPNASLAEVIQLLVLMEVVTNLKVYLVALEVA